MPEADALDQIYRLLWRASRRRVERQANEIVRLLMTWKAA